MTSPSFMPRIPFLTAPRALGAHSVVSPARLPARPPVRRAAELLGRVARVVRRVIGVPDYDAYVAHVTRCHPGTAPLARDAFVRDVLTRRYERPGSRCC